METEVAKEAVNATDEELAAQAAAGSRSAFEELVSRYSLRLFHFLRSCSRSDEDVEDLTQETFLRAYRNIGRYDPQRRFSTWLYTMAIRLSISRQRSQRKKLLSLEREGPDESTPGPRKA